MWANWDRNIKRNAKPTDSSNSQIFEHFVRRKNVRHLGAKFVIRIFIIMFNQSWFIFFIRIIESRCISSLSYLIFGRESTDSVGKTWTTNGVELVENSSSVRFYNTKIRIQNTICWLLARTKVRWMTYLTCECYIQIICLMHVISTYRGTRKLNKEWEETSKKKWSRVREKKKQQQRNGKTTSNSENQCVLVYGSQNRPFRLNDSFIY